MCAISMALLTGNPIVGLLLHVPEYKWERPVIFCGVSISSFKSSQVIKNLASENRP